MEETQRAFTRRVSGCWDLSYWDRLVKLRLQSIQRRHERYKAIYIWKILTGIVPNVGFKFGENQRFGTTVKIPNIKGPINKYTTIRENSMYVEGGKIFNGLPKSLRSFRGSKEKFKSHLDAFLEEVPDHPNGYRTQIPDIVDTNCKPTNLIRDWVKNLNLSEWSSPTLDEDLRKMRSKEEMREAATLGDQELGTGLVQ